MDRQSTFRSSHISEKESMFITKSNLEIGNWPKEAGGEKGGIRDFKYKLAVVPGLPSQKMYVLLSFCQVGLSLGINTRA